MSIGNQKFGIPRKYQNQIGIWYFFPKFLGIFLVFYRYFEKDLIQIWLNIGVFGRIKIVLVFGFRGCHFIGIGLVSVCHFPENGISSTDRYTGRSAPAHTSQPHQRHPNMVYPLSAASTAGTGVSIASLCSVYT